VGNKPAVTAKSATGAKPGPVTRSASVRSAAGRNVAMRKPVGRTTTAVSARTARSRRSTVSTRPARVYTPRQSSPTPDRYKEIQDALYSKGYLKTPPSGVWDQESADSLRRFQQDQKLDPTGKLTARSLMALGLGSRTSSEAPPLDSSASLNELSTEPVSSR
jgi:hypothetical protein